jgi:BirA family biotin operon repressor/biotin-[acetyl-CoA-carboxylase] ligase
LYDLHQEEGFEPVSERWRDLTSTLGRLVRVRTAERQFEGIARDLDSQGALLVTVGDLTERVVAGDVEELRTR